jgi:hypothetical protein
MITAAHANKIFDDCITKYHEIDNVDQPLNNPFAKGSFDNVLYNKCWIDTIQWHYEDLIRVPDIDPAEGMNLKRLIDASNQRRTDMVERIDDFFLEYFADVETAEDARINSESPAWVIDRLSILALKIYHMKEQSERDDVSDEHRQNSLERLAVLQEQQLDLSTSLNELVDDLADGKMKMKVYRQMKLYNDPSTNPALYEKKA